MLREFAAWLASTPLSVKFDETTWVVPTSQSFHIIAVSVVFASAMLINLRLMGIGLSGRSVAELVDLLTPWIWRGLAVLLATGIVQTIAEPVRQFVTPAFWAKMIMVIVVATLTAFYTRAVRRHARDWSGTTGRSGARTFAIVTTLLWVAIIACGRFIGYVWNLYV